MKTYLKSTLLVWCMINMSLGAIAQGKSRFSEINLNELRRTVIKQLLADDLIEHKKELVYLFLHEEGISLNGVRLGNSFQSSYQSLLSGFKIGTGPDRTILISRDCTAVGDFTNEGSFHGKSEGRLRVEYNRKPWQ